MFICWSGIDIDIEWSQYPQCVYRDGTVFLLGLQLPMKLCFVCIYIYAHKHLKIKCRHIQTLLNAYRNTYTNIYILYAYICVYRDTHIYIYKYLCMNIQKYVSTHTQIYIYIDRHIDIDITLSIYLCIDRYNLYTYIYK